MFRNTHLCAALALVGMAAGCGGVKEEQIEVKADNDPLVAARAVLQRYADGQPMTSEVTSFPKLVEDVRAKDPQRADVLEKGLADLQKSPPNARAAKAKDLLRKLQPSMT